jgi:hypothetical protein
MQSVVVVVVVFERSRRSTTRLLPLRVGDRARPPSRPDRSKVTRSTVRPLLACFLPTDADRPSTSSIPLPRLQVMSLRPTTFSTLRSSRAACPSAIMPVAALGRRRLASATKPSVLPSRPSLHTGRPLKLTPFLPCSSIHSRSAGRQVRLLLSTGSENLRRGLRQAKAVFLLRAWARSLSLTSCPRPIRSGAADPQPSS